MVTEVTLTNRAAEPGILKVCKVAGTGVVPGTPFRFTVGSTPVQVRAGSCSLPLSAPDGNLAITEAPAEGTERKPAPKPKPRPVPGVTMQPPEPDPAS